MSNDLGIKIQHAGIHVRNLEETVQWYHDILGFELVDTRPEMRGGMFPKCWMMKCGDFFLEIYEVINARPFSYVDYEYNLGVKHLSFSVEKIDELMDKIYARGDVKVIVDNCYAEEMCRVKGGDRAVYLEDCNGMLVELQKSHEKKLEQH